MRYLVLLACLAASRAPAEEPRPGVVSGLYDRFQNRGSLGVSWVVLPSVGTSSLGKLEMNVSLVYRGEPGKSTPTSAFVSMSAITGELTYLTYHPFGCIIDGERHNFELIKHTSNILGGDPFEIHEQIGIFVPTNFVKTLASSYKAECRLGLREFEIPDPFRIGLRTLVAEGFPAAKPKGPAKKKARP